MNNIRKGDKVLFLLPNYPVYDQEGRDIFEKLKPTTSIEERRISCQE